MRDGGILALLLLGCSCAVHAYYQPISQIQAALPYLAHAGSHAPIDVSRGSMAGKFVSMRAAVVGSLGIRFVPPGFSMASHGEAPVLPCTESDAAVCSSAGPLRDDIMSNVFPTGGEVLVQDPSSSNSFSRYAHWESLVASGCGSVDGAFRGAQPRVPWAACQPPGLARIDLTLSVRIGEQGARSWPRHRPAGSRGTTSPCAMSAGRDGGSSSTRRSSRCAST